MKRVRFKTGAPLFDETALCSTFRSKDRNPDKYGTFDFDFELRTLGIYLKMAFWGTAIGFLLAAPHIVAAITDDTLASSKLVLVCLLYLALGLITGNLAAFKLKNSI
jgi:ABC-type phosphate/phosphonate transport system permease subunit